MSFQDVYPRRPVEDHCVKSTSGMRQIFRENSTISRHERKAFEISHGDHSHCTPRRRQTRTANVVTPPSSCSKPKSRITRLSDEVVHFQKLVLKLELILKKNVQSPEDQWRSRILVRSAEEANHDIFQKLRSQEHDLQHCVSDKKTRLVHSKLSRDYGRIQNSFQSLLSQYNVTSDGDIPSPVEWLSPEEIQKKLIAQQQEDFFVRAMREREAEVQGINRSMHQVNEIYKELGRVVETQQDKINAIEESIGLSTANAQCGLDQVEQANSPSCMEIAFEQERDSPPATDLRWSTPFETIGEDMRSVQMDIVGLGRDLLTYSTGAKLLKGRPSMLHCASVEDVSDSVYYE